MVVSARLLRKEWIVTNNSEKVACMLVRSHQVEGRGHRAGPAAQCPTSSMFQQLEWIMLDLADGKCRLGGAEAMVSSEEHCRI